MNRPAEIKDRIKLLNEIRQVKKEIEDRTGKDIGHIKFTQKV